MKDKDSMATKLSLDSLEYVVGGASASDTYTCPRCGQVFKKFDTLLGEMEAKNHMAVCLLEKNLENL